MKQTHILLIFGGMSSEHEVSLMSARNIVDVIDPDTYHVELCVIDKKGVWYSVDEVREPIDTDEEIIADLGRKKFITNRTNRLIQPGVIFPILHGRFGEDGTIQGLFEMMQIPYVGCDVEASALCMDKIRTKMLLSALSIATTQSFSFTSAGSFEKTISTGGDGFLDEFTEQLGPGPWFVKPSRAGSSVGVSKVHDFDKLLPAVKEAFAYDKEILIEKAISDMHEIEVAVLGNHGSDTVVSAPGEIIPGEEFYSYEDKYAEDSKSQISFEIADSIRDLSAEISEIAKLAYGALGCSGLS
ncbi:hypothetical protein B7Z28_01260, partial [Candidatus Saccharibacteria bacterium 32-45-3]